MKTPCYIYYIADGVNLRLRFPSYGKAEKWLMYFAHYYTIRFGGPVPLAHATGETYNAFGEQTP